MASPAPASTVPTASTASASAAGPAATTPGLPATLFPASGLLPAPVAPAPSDPEVLQTYVQTGSSSIGMSGANRPVLNLGLSFKLPINELIDAVLR